MTSGQHADAPSVGEIRSRTRCWWRSKTWRHRLGGRGLPQGLGSASSVATSELPAIGRSGCARTICSRPIAAAAVAAIHHDGEIIIDAPNLTITDGVRGVHGGRRLGLDLHRRRALERRVCRLACKRGDRFAALQPLHGACGLFSTATAGLADGSRLPVSVAPLRDQVLGHPAVLQAEPQTNGVAERFNRTLKEQITMVASTATSRSCGTPARLRRTRAKWIVENHGYLSPAQARRRGTPDLNQDAA